MKKGNTSKLLENTYESYYWLGFICADGHISKTYRLKVCLSKKDKNHLEKLAKFLKKENIWFNEKLNSYEFSIMDTKNLKELCNKYNITHNKTYNPINFSGVKGIRNKLAFIAGFIDGDGSIRNLHKRKDFNLVIKCHSSWVNVLNQFSKIICNKENAYVNNQNYSFLSIGNSQILKKLKKILIKLEIPLLKRKWDIINNDFISKIEKAEYNLKSVISLLKQGKTQKEISIILKMNKSSISLIIKRNNIKYENKK